MSRNQWVQRLVWLALAGILLHLLVQLWSVAMYLRAARQARPVVAHIERLDFGYESSSGASIRVVTLHFFLLDRPDRYLNSISASCVSRCPVDIANQHMQVDSLEKLVGQDHHAFVLGDGQEVYLHLLTDAEVRGQVGISLLFHAMVAVGVAAISHLLKKEEEGSL
jgi:hypothetical protein